MKIGVNLLNLGSEKLQILRGMGKLMKIKEFIRTWNTRINRGGTIK